MRGRAAGATAAALALVLGLAGCSSTSAPSKAPGRASTSVGTLSTVLSPRQAAAILGRTTATNNKANASLDLGLLRSYESGSAFEIDGAQYKMTSLAKRLGTKPSPYAAFTIRPLQVVVDGGRSYPVGFLAVGSTYLEGTAKASGSCPHADTLLQYEKASASSPWRIVLEPAADEGRFVDLAAAHGIAVPLSASERSAADTVPQRVVTELQNYEVSGHLGPLTPGDFNGACWAISDPRKELEQTEAAGFSGRELYHPAKGTVAYVIAPAAGAGASTASRSAAGAKGQGGVLVLFSLVFDDELFAGGSSPIDWTVSPASDPVSVLLPAGRYSEIYEHGDLELAAELAGDGRISIVGAYEGVTSVTGTRAKSGGGGGSTLVADRLP